MSNEDAQITVAALRSIERQAERTAAALDRVLALAARVEDIAVRPPKKKRRKSK